MNWKTVSGFLPTDVHYEAAPSEGVQVRIDSTFQDNWPAFRWSVDVCIEGHMLHHDEIAVDLPSAKHAAENYVATNLASLRGKK